MGSSDTTNQTTTTTTTKNHRHSTAGSGEERTTVVVYAACLFGVVAPTKHSSEWEFVGARCCEDYSVGADGGGVAGGLLFVRIGFVDVVVCSFGSEWVDWNGVFVAAAAAAMVGVAIARGGPTGDERPGRRRRQHPYIPPRDDENDPASKTRVASRSLSPHSWGDGCSFGWWWHSTPPHPAEATRPSRRKSPVRMDCRYAAAAGEPYSSSVWVREYRE